MQTRALIRTLQLISPVMHKVDVRIHHYNVPFRILWPGWEDFITNKDNTPPPTISATPANTVTGSLLDYLGVPAVQSGSVDINALYVRAYNMIWDEYYRDQDLVPGIGETNGPTEDDLGIKNIAWEKDYFTAARPWPQKGEAITVPFGESTVDVTGTITNPQPTSNITGNANSGPSGFDEALVPNGQDGIINIGDPSFDLEVQLGQQGGQLSIRALREAAAEQRYLENQARYGNRYVDYLRAQGVIPSDGRLSRPEYLGGGNQMISFSEVISTGTGVELGELAGHGIAHMRSNKFERSIEENGIVMSVMSIRPKAIYENGLDRKFFKTTKEDYFQHELEHIGQRTVQNKELNISHNDPDGTFGWSNRYQEYREEKSRISGEMKSWQRTFHQARQLPTDVALNQSFVECVPTEAIFGFTNTDITQPIQFLADHKIKVRRRVSANPEPKLI